MSSIIRDLKYTDIGTCREIVRAEWGDEAAERAHIQMVQMFSTSPRDLPPHFYVAVEGSEIIGFAGFKATMLMKNAYDLIWICLTPKAQGQGIGTALTLQRLAEIVERGGTMVSLMTQKPAYFKRFGFEVVKVFDGWHLMVRQLAKVDI